MQGKKAKRKLTTRRRAVPVSDRVRARGAADEGMAEHGTDEAVVVKTLHGGALHRHTVRTLAELRGVLGGAPELSYVDDEGDRVAVTGEADFREAVRFARAQGARAVRLDLAWPAPVSSAPARGALDAMQRRIESNMREISRLAALVNPVDPHDPVSEVGHEDDDEHEEEKQEEKQEQEEKQKQEQVDGETKMQTETQTEQQPEAEEQEQQQEGVEQQREEVEHETPKEQLEEEHEMEMPEPSAPPSEVEEEEGGIAAACRDTAQRTAAQCETLFAAHAAETAVQCAGQAARSAAATRAAAALVSGTAAQLADALAPEPGHARAEAQRLAEDVVTICARLAQETAESCSAITLCIAEMVRRT